nr:PREDICTED: protein TPR1-like [Nicotiana tabacum]
MANDVSGVNLEEAVPCIALSKNDSYVMSAAGGKVSLFNMMTFKVMTTFMPPPPASTFLAFHPQDNNIIAIGMEDSTIHIYNVRVDEVKSKLKGHQKRITGLAFSTNLNILVSSGADAQLCLWSIDTWDKRKSVLIQLPAGKAPSGDTRVQFHSDQVRLLVSHETQLAIYDASKMERIRQWVPQDALSAPITYAAYSCNSQLVYASFSDGNVGVFDADTLRLRCRVAPSAYLPQAVLTGSQAVYPLVVAAHPQEPSQFAVGLSDGTVKVIEPLESEGKWGLSPPVDNGILNGRTASSSTTSNHVADQVQR